jgi:hypothetical protein
MKDQLGKTDRKRVAEDLAAPAPPQNPGGQRSITRQQYDSFTPKNQGYATYMQGSWNPSVPNECPFPAGSAERTQWEAGNHQAMLDVQDGEE